MFASPFAQSGIPVVRSLRFAFLPVALLGISSLQGIACKQSLLLLRSSIRTSGKIEQAHLPLGLSSGRPETSCRKAAQLLIAAKK
jgi:hypothetical protein